VTVLTRSRIRTQADLRPARVLLRDGLAPLLQRAAVGAAGLRRRDAVRLAAAIELARRGTAPTEQELFRVERYVPRLVARYALHVQEHLGVILLDTRSRIIAEREVFVGTLDAATVSTRDVVRLALDLHARHVVVFHNHPSGDPQPSDEDVSYTRRLAAAAQLLDVDVVDHLVLGRRRYISMKHEGYF
jgi:DNA repair protein RadC